MYLTKGSPESILSMCASSSIPDSISDNLTSLAKRGLRVLAFAYKSYGDNRDVAMHLHPEEVESSRSLLFGGLLCLTSKLKVDAIQTVRELMDADIQVKMITGDHVRTAMAVAADCSIVPPIESSVDNAEREAMKFDLTSLTKDYHYIVDENEAGYVSIIDVFTDSHTDLSVVQLLELAARADEKQGLSFGTFAYQATSGNDDVEEGASLLAGVTTGEVQGDLGAKGSSEYTTFPSTTLSMSALLNRSGRIHIAVTGRGIAAVKRVYAPFVVDSLLRCTKVFARAKPTDKQFIVEELQKTPKFGKNYDERSTLQPTTESVVGTEFGNNQGKPGSSEEKPPSRQQDDDIILFTGDGANDMAALRTANVGLSLCDVETSIAAPVTSKSGSPGAVLELLKEARASLMIGFSLAHFYILFSTIMLFEIVILFDYGLILSDSMFFVQGIYEILGGVVLILAVRRDKLSEELPPVRYFSYDLMVVFVPQFILIPIFQILALVMLSYQDFYVRYETDDPLMHSYAFETAVLQNVALMQLAIITITSSIGSPFTSEWWEDWRFVFVVVVEIVWALYQTFAGASSFAENTLNLEPVPTSFGYDLVIFYVVMFAVSLLTWTASHRLLRVARRRRKLPALLLEN
jgi:magnesium-transporting ATPase (P-type)